MPRSDRPVRRYRRANRNPSFSGFARASRARCLALFAGAMAACAAQGQTIVTTDPLSSSFARFIPLGSLPGVPAAFRGSAALGISGDGKVVVGQANSPQGGQAFRWTATEGMIALGDLPGGDFNSSALATNFDGSVVIGRGKSAASNPNDEAFRWTASTGMVALGDLPGGFYLSQAIAVSSNGETVVGVSASDQGFEAFRWTTRWGLRGLGFIPGSLPPTVATSMSADGNVVYGYGFRGAGFEGFRWTSATGIVPIGELPGGTQFAVPNACTPDGNITVGGSASALTNAGVEAARWAVGGAGWQGYGLLPGASPATAQAQFFGISASGWIAVGQASDGDGQHAVIWDPSRGLRRVRDFLLELNAEGSAQLAGWKLTNATGISADGRWIVGLGTGPGNVLEAWMAAIPEYQYANCDGSMVIPVLNAADMACFLERFSRGDLAANCDGSTEPPILNSADFICFTQLFIRGVP